jgi:hypothetical protein
MLNIAIKIRFFLIRYYLYNVCILSILFISLGKYWLLISFLTFLSLIFVKYDYWKRKKLYFVPIFYLNSKNIILNIIYKININFAAFLTCTSFSLVDIIIHTIDAAENMKNNFNNKPR